MHRLLFVQGFILFTSGGNIMDEPIYTLQNAEGEKLMADEKITATEAKVDSRSPLELFLAGESVNAYEYMGAHKCYRDGLDGVVFRVWAPNALTVSVAGDFNSWDNMKNYMERVDGTGVWECFIPNVNQYQAYKYCVETPWFEKLYKTDPYGYHCQTRPDNASLYYDLDGFEWTDTGWQEKKAEKPHYERPMNIYEVHAGSWRLNEDGSRYSLSLIHI